MRAFRRTLIAAIVSAGTAVSLAACAAADAIVASGNATAAKLATATLVKCPTNQSAATSAVVGPLGGTINLGATSVQIPAGALLDTVTVNVTEPASQFMEIDVSVEGVEHFVFELPVVVTLSYARCSRSNIDQRPLSVWYIDSNTHELLEPMGGVDDKLTRTITFVTPHFSGYAVAN
jgi:hypothetical protein